MDLEMMQEFLVEAKDLLEQTDEKLVQLEKHPQDADLLNAVFRGYHTIKGSAGFLQLDGFVRLCHALETLFDALRSQTITMNASIMDASLEASNEIRRAMNLYTVNPETAYLPPEDLVEDLLLLATGQSLVPDEVHMTSSSPHSSSDSDSDSGSGSATDSYWNSLYQSIQPSSHTASPTSPSSIEPIMTAPSSPVLTPSLVAPPPSAAPAHHPRSAPSPAPVESFKNEKETQIKVDTSRLDAVLTLASEVGLAKNRVGAAKSRILAKDFSEEALADLERAVNDLDRLTGSLQNAVMLTRMQPIGRLFSRYPRMVRDLARTLSKNIEIVISGNETEIDKGMIEDLADPLVHLIRNSADHGIETPDKRILSGKPEVGTIRLTARQEGDRILIEIQDDGKGIDPNFIRAKAKVKNLMDHGRIDALSDQQALELIFAPGFSTAETISSVSGRGVGMDVVKTNITKMGGEINIESTPGSGTTMQIRLPLTLAVLPALILKAGGQSLALPLSSVQEILSLEEYKPQTTAGKPVINLRGEIIRVLDLSDLLGFGESPDAPVAALVDLGNGRRAALRAEGFIGRDEVMVKALEGVKPKGVSGVIVDAQGDIVLILDLKELLSGVFASMRDK